MSNPPPPSPSPFAPPRRGALRRAFPLGAAAATVAALAAAACMSTPAPEPMPAPPPAAAAPAPAAAMAAAPDTARPRLRAAAQLPLVLREIAVPAPSDTLREPLVVPSVGKVLNAVLEVIQDSFAVPGVGKERLSAYRLVSANGRTYNRAGFPGPTFRIHPGDSVHITLINHLPPDSAQHRCLNYGATTSNPPRDSIPNCFHGPNTTNIHYHGFHVTPDGTGDNVLLEIGPDSTWQFAFRVPMDQSPGTHWYHPHKHGSVAIEVTNGMSGAFEIVGGGLDSLTQANHIREHLVGVQQVDSMVNLIGSTGPGVKLVNGQADPVIIMRPREVQRWRIVNENVSQSTTYKVLFPATDLTAPKMYDIARDGVQYAPSNYSTVPDTSLILGPGNRLDVFVQAPADTGTHLFRAVIAANTRGQRELPQLRANARGGTQTLLRVRVVADGTPVQTQLPQALPPLPGFLGNLAVPATPAATVVFTDSGPQGGVGPAFYLGNGANPYQRFNPGTPFIQMPLGATQLWVVQNTTQNALSHPFHIHINPFQVVRVSYGPTDPNAALFQQLATAAGKDPIWLDVIPLPVPYTNAAGVTVPGEVQIVQQYTDFTGTFVMHCHILGHEERGMMQLLQIVAPTSMAPPGTAPPPAAGGHSHH